MIKTTVLLKDGRVLENCVSVTASLLLPGFIDIVIRIGSGITVPASEIKEIQEEYEKAGDPE